VRHLSKDEAARVIKFVNGFLFAKAVCLTMLRSRALNPGYKRISVLGLNSILLESPTVIHESVYADDVPTTIVNGIGHKTVSVYDRSHGERCTDLLIQPFVSDNCVLAGGKYLLSEHTSKSFETVKSILESLAQAIKGPASASANTKRLALVVVRTVSRTREDVSTLFLDPFRVCRS
jgi:hypothetical protein